jgi:hypothetical protein
MKTLTATLFVAALTSMLGCSPSGEMPPPAAEPTPTVLAEEKITDLDFESGEVELPVSSEADTEPDDPSQ